MASYTPNLNLILPVGTEKVSRAIVNSNNTIIDGAIGGIINPSVESVGSLAALKTYLLSVASSATARKNVYVQFNVTAASSPFSAGLYTGNLQKETNGSFSVLCHGNAGGVVEVQYNATNTTWTIMNFNDEISALNGKLTIQTYSFTLHEYTGANEVSVKRGSGDLTISGWIQITNTLAKSEWLLTITNPPTPICKYWFRLYEANTDYPAYLTTNGHIEVDAQVPAGYYNFGLTVPIE